MDESTKVMCDGIIEEQRWLESSEGIYHNLKLQIADFESRWAQWKEKRRAMVKKGVLDPDTPEELRLERCLWYKPAKARARYHGRVAILKSEILDELKDKIPKRLSEIQFMVGVQESLKDWTLSPFIQAIRELEREGLVRVNREPGMSNSAAAGIITEAFSEQYPNNPVNRTTYTVAPGHGGDGTMCICGGCELVKL